MVQDTELLIDYVEAGRRISCGRTTIYALVDRGELQTVKIGRRSLITSESLRALVERLASARAGGDAA